MATFLELAKIKHHAVRSDGAKFLDGVRNDSLNTSWLTVNSSGRVTLGPGLYDELLVVKDEVSDEQIKAWASMGAPFYDLSPMTPIDASQRPVSVHGAGADIEMDKYGIRATRKADGKKTFEIDAETGDAYFRGDITGASGTFSGNLSAEKIMAGIVAAGGIITDNVLVTSESGNIYFSGETIVVKDENNVVRVRIGRLS
jgi:hypothetical protein